MSTLLKGGCACGAVRYECSAEPLYAGHCQCLDCQRYNGAGHASGFGMTEDAVSMTGDVKFHDTTADSGGTVRRGFCPECGSPVMSKNSGPGNMLFIHATTLDDASLFKPTAVIYAASALPWDHMDPALAAFDKIPPLG
jgi:hypothetical protein